MTGKLPNLACQLAPQQITKCYRNQWGLTPIDSLSTAIVMNNRDVVKAILDFIPSIDFSTTRKPHEYISLFESTTHYLGGLLASMNALTIEALSNIITVYQ